jgi:hypothetical protein
MNLWELHRFRIPFLIITVLFLSACAAGNSQFNEQAPAGFWYGLWHGIISIIALVVHIFNDHVMVYETHNTGGWYDFGFLLGVIFVWGGGCHMKCRRSRQKQQDKEWDAIGEKIEIKVKQKMKEWSEDEEWDDIGVR